jgi:hypothetical protein
MQKSLDMIAHRATQLTRFTRALLRFRFGDAAAALGLDRKFAAKMRKWRQRDKTFADAHLEYAFGWAPLYGDIQQSLLVLTRGLPSVLVKGRGMVRGTYHKTWGDGVYHQDSATYDSAHEITSRVGGVNPNQTTLNQLGLVNPVSAFWEVVPFSFLIDYVANVGDYLDSFTDTVGYQLLDTNWSWRGRMKSSQYVRWGNGNPPNGGAASWSSERARLQRTVGALPGPELQILWNWRMSPQRAGTSISLLLQCLDSSQGFSHWSRKGL